MPLRQSMSPPSAWRPRVVHSSALPFGRARCCRSRVRVECNAMAAAQQRNYYETLGIRDTASVRDIKDAFRRLALTWHPDHCKQPGAKDKFMELKTAYDTLVDLTARAKYDLQLKQARAPPPMAQPTRPSHVGYDWSKHRAPSVRRSTSAKSPAPQHATGFASSTTVPPRPQSRSPFGDDFDSRSSSASSAQAFGSQSAASPHVSAGTRSNSTTSTSGYSNGQYSSIFSNDTSPHGFARSSSSGPQPGDPTTYAHGRSTSVRSGSRSRYGRSSTPRRSGSTSASTRAASPTPAQQWHAAYCHSGDDFIAASGTSYAATATLTPVSTPASNWTAQPWHYNASGDGFANAALAAPVASTPQAVDLASSWRSPAAAAYSGDDYVPYQHAPVAPAVRTAPTAPAPSPAAAVAAAARAPAPAPSPAPAPVPARITPVDHSNLPAKLTPLWSALADFVSIRIW